MILTQTVNRHLLKYGPTRINNFLSLFIITLRDKFSFTQLNCEFIIINTRVTKFSTCHYNYLWHYGSYRLPTSHLNVLTDRYYHFQYIIKLYNFICIR